MSAENTPAGSRLPFPEDALAAEAPAHLEDRIVERLRERRLLEPVAPPRSAWFRFAWAASVAAAFLLGWALHASATTPAARPSANYMLLLDHDPANELTAELLAERIDEYGEWAGDLAENDLLVAGARLLPNPIRLGPAPSSDEVSGFFLLDAKDEQQAREIAEACPHLRHGGSVVLQPIDEEASSISE